MRHFQTAAMLLVLAGTSKHGHHGTSFQGQQLCSPSAPGLKQSARLSQAMAGCAVPARLCSHTLTSMSKAHPPQTYIRGMALCKCHTTHRSDAVVVFLVQQQYNSSGPDRVVIQKTLLGATAVTVHLLDIKCGYLYRNSVHVCCLLSVQVPCWPQLLVTPPPLGTAALQKPSRQMT